MPVSTWLAAGATTLGVGAALLGGAGAANAKPSNSASSDSSHSGHSDSAHPSRAHHAKDNSTAGSNTASTTGGGSDSSGDAGKHRGTDHAAKTDSAGTEKKTLKPQRRNNNRPTADTGRQAVSATAAASGDKASDTAPAPRHPKPTKATDASDKSAAPRHQRRETSATTTESTAVVSAAADTPSVSTPDGATTAKAAPSRSTDASGVLSVLAAVGQALTVSVRNTELTLAKAAHNTELTLNGLFHSAAPAATTTEATPAADDPAVLPTGLTTPVTPVNTLDQAISEIQQAQAAFKAASSWNRMFSGYSAWLLGIALKNLNQYQANQDTLMAAYAANPTAANLKALQANEALPAHAVTCLKNAAAWSGISGLKSNAKLAAADGLVYGSVPLSMYLGTEPIIKISINGGPMIKVLVDTGSSGLVIPAKYAGKASTLGDVVGSGTSGFGTGVGSAAVVYDFDQYNTTVNFGNGLKTGTVTVNVVTAGTQSGYLNYIGQDGVVGVLGIGTNAVGPGGSIVSTALPGLLSSGVFIDEKNKKLWFGPNPLPVVTSIPGSPNVTGYISVNGGSKNPVNMLLDSGGVFGTIPQSIAGSAGSSGVLAKGTVVTVYAADGTTVLFTYTVTSTSSSPTVTVDTTPQALNTGYQPFKLGPMYINYVDGVTVIADEDGHPITYYGETDFDY